MPQVCYRRPMGASIRLNTTLHPRIQRSQSPGIPRLLYIPRQQAIRRIHQDGSVSKLALRGSSISTRRKGKMVSPPRKGWASLSFRGCRPVKGLHNVQVLSSPRCKRLYLLVPARIRPTLPLLQPCMLIRVPRTHRRERD